MRRHIWLLVIIAAVVLGALPVLFYPLGRDQGMYANIGVSILHGGVPYVTMWDIKPPPIYYVYALGLALFGQTPTGIHALDFVAVPLGMIGLAWIGQQVANRRTGLFAALLYGVFYFSDQFANVAQSDPIATIPTIFAVAAAMQARAAPAGARRALLWAGACGALCGLVLWFKQYYALIVMVLVAQHLLARWGQRRALLHEVLAFSVGGLLTGGGLLAFFAVQGMLPDMLIVAQSTSAYNSQLDFGAFLGQMGSYFAFRWLYWAPLFVCGAAGAVLALRDRNGRFIVAWLIAGTAFMLAQRLGFDTHWYTMLPPLALLSAQALDAGARRLASIRWAERAYVGVVGACILGWLAYNTWLPFVPYAQGQETQEQYFARFQANDLKPEQSLAVVDYLRDKLVRGDSLYVFGFRPEVAFMGGWRPATRYQAQFPVVGTRYPLAWQQDNVDILWAALPPYALIVRDDFMPWVTGIDADSYTILQDYIELNNWYIANYDIIETLGDFIICRRKPLTS